MTDPTRIGLIADTHLPFRGAFLWDEISGAFAGVDLILHAGDIIHPAVLDRLEQIAPVRAARGNNDAGVDDPRIEDLQWLDLHGRTLVVVHDTEPEAQPVDQIQRLHLAGRHADIVVSGHTHLERLDFREGVLQINPGSATLPHLRSYRLGTVGILTCSQDGIEVQIRRLGESPGLPNPGVELAFSLDAGVSLLG